MLAVYHLILAYFLELINILLARSIRPAAAWGIMPALSEPLAGLHLTLLSIFKEQLR